MKEMVNSRTD